MRSTRASHVLDFVNAIPVGVKSFVAAAILLICMVTLGTNAYLTSLRSAAGLRVLSSEVIPKQRALDDLRDNAIAAQIKIFRYVSWASNGVSGKLLDDIYIGINSDLNAISNGIGFLARRSDLSEEDMSDLRGLLIKWELCKTHAMDNIEVGRTDAPMATMLLGQTDDSFSDVETILHKLGLAVTATADRLESQLYSYAEQTEQIIIWVTFTGILISLAVSAFVAKSIVQPIKDITDVMERLSVGQTEVDLGHHGRRDEIGKMFGAMQNFRGALVEANHLRTERDISRANELLIVQQLADQTNIQRQRLDAALANMSQGLCMFDADEKLIIFNQRIAEILNLMPEKVTAGMMAHEFMRLGFSGKGLADIDPQSEPPLKQNVADERRQGSLVKCLADGRNIAISIGPMPDGGFVFTFEDITARTRLDDALRQSQERLTLATESARIAIWDYDVGANKLIWDARMYELYGIREQDFSGAYEAWRAGLHPEDRARGDAAVSDAINRVRDFNVEFRVLWPNGEVRDIEAHALVQGPEHGPATRMIGVNWDITERKRAEEQIVRLARYDGLTGLANRSVFVEALEQSIIRARRHGTRFAVLYLDLDHFKDINDALGHPVGDQLLRVVAERLRSSVRVTDMVARFGGDEFAVLLSDIEEPANAVLVSDRFFDAASEPIDFSSETAAIAANSAEKIVIAVREPMNIQANRIHTGVSIGIAVYGLDTPDAEAMLSHADVALYRAKAEHRGGHRFFTDGMDAEVRARISLGTELREAITSNQFFLMYQPQVDIDTGRTVGLEALVRWRHPTLGTIGPGKFIPEAERSGLIVPLGRWVLREACQQVKRWIDLGIVLPLVAVNMSGVQFRLPLELERDIAASVAEAGLSPELLELELTESVLMEASRVHNDLLLRLRDNGYRIAIDDFGSGYSSLDYLRRYPVDRIKIAQKFISEIGIEPGSDAIVRAALGLALELNIDVVVEGVETAAQLELLRDWGARTIQGYYYSRPAPVGEVTKMLLIGKIAPTCGRPDPNREASVSPSTDGRYVTLPIRTSLS